MWLWLRPLLFSLPPETAHNWVFAIAKALDRVGIWKGDIPSVLPKTLWGLSFRHPIGLAAGLDKNGILLNLWKHLGFAFVEVGTVTPRPQPGNPRPRLFRIPAHEALLNRMGFNNEGAVALARRLEKRPEHLIVGINIGKNRDTPLEEAYKDYVTAFQTLQDAGDFFVLNVSSPNTPGLRSLQSEKNLLPIIDAVQAINTKHKPLLLKLSPDLPLEAIEEIGKVATGAGIAGFVAGNTTTQIKYPALGEGGVSGKPLRPLRKRLVEALRPFRLPIIGVGGIASGADIRECLLEGAELVEIYTGLIYKGPGLVREGLEAVSASHLRTP